MLTENVYKMEGETCCEVMIFWTKFNEAKENAIKEKWLELFLFTFNQYSESTSSDHLYKHCSISSSAASKLTNFTLQHIYGLIYASLKGIDSDEHLNLLDTSNDNKNDVNDGCDLKTHRNDITTIVALREFLIHGIGGRILETFQYLDTK
ncbi:hypothetical protein Bhyg_16979, partial [Pseudolycoriella hygida]